LASYRVVTTASRRTHLGCLSLSTSGSDRRPILQPEGEHSSTEADPSLLFRRHSGSVLLQPLVTDPIDSYQVGDRAVEPLLDDPPCGHGPPPVSPYDSAWVAALMSISWPSAFWTLFASASPLSGGPRAAGLWLDTSHVLPSRITPTEPSWSVLSGGKSSREQRQGLGLGWPYSLPRPRLATASRGRTISSQRASVPLRLRWRASFKRGFGNLGGLRDRIPRFP
jgi:hypothetical protein